MVKKEKKRILRYENETKTRSTNSTHEKRYFFLPRNFDFLLYSVVLMPLQCCQLNKWIISVKEFWILNFNRLSWQDIFVIIIWVVVTLCFFFLMAWQNAKATTLLNNLDRFLILEFLQRKTCHILSAIFAMYVTMRKKSIPQFGKKKSHFVWYFCSSHLCSGKKSVLPYLKLVTNTLHSALSVTQCHTVKTYIYNCCEKIIKSLGFSSLHLANAIFGNILADVSKRKNKNSLGVRSVNFSKKKIWIFS